MARASAAALSITAAAMSLLAGRPALPVSAGVGTVTGAGVGSTVAGGVGAAVGAAVGTAVGLAVGLAVGVGVATCANALVTVAEQFVRAPPPFAEPLHWSTFTRKPATVVEVVLTVQVNPTLVPPLPEPLH